MGGVLGLARVSWDLLGPHDSLARGWLLTFIVSVMQVGDDGLLLEDMDNKPAMSAEDLHLHFPLPFGMAWGVRKGAAKQGMAKGLRSMRR